MSSGSKPRVPIGTLIVYGLAGAPVYFTFMLGSVYLLKYASDVLLVAPGLMGVLYGLSRIWDAISDPVAGFLSDRTRSRLGRRRSWLLASILPIAAGFAMIWSPPGALEGSALVVWMGVGVFVYYTGTTVFSIPHDSLGAELTTDYHDRTRVFGVKTAVGQTGSLLALAALFLLIDSQDKRATAGWIVVAATVALAVLVGLAVARLRERREYQQRGATHLSAAFRDVLANPHAVPLLFVFFIENFGTACLGVMTPFVMQYVLDMEGKTAVFIGIYFVPALLFIPLWIRLSRSIGKRRLWVFAVATLTAAFSGLFFVRPGEEWLVYLLGTVAGIGGGCGQVVGPSIEADIIDYDELRTGERKEGAYFAVWNFMRKSAYGISAMLSGILLQAVGFEANAVQSPSTILGMRALFGLLPGTCYLLALVALLRFRLDEEEHTRIRRALDERALRAEEELRTGGP